MDYVPDNFENMTSLSLLAGRTVADHVGTLQLFLLFLLYLIVGLYSL